MPTVHFRGRDIECEEGAILRDVLLDADETPHNGASKYLNCHGRGACGTCAVAVSGEVSAKNPTEVRRLSQPPFGDVDGLRLACQTRVKGDVTVTKHDGFFGHKVSSDDEHSS